MRWTIRRVLGPTQRKWVGRGRAQRTPLLITTPMEVGGEEPSAHPTRKVMPQKTISSRRRLGLCMAPEARSCGSTATCTSKPGTTFRTRQAWGQVRESTPSTAPWCSEPNGNRLGPVKRKGTVSVLVLTALRKISAHPLSRREDAGRGVTRRRSIPLKENGTSMPLFRA